MLVNAKEMLLKAKKEGYAVGAFNINNLEWTKSILACGSGNEQPGYAWSIRGSRQVHDRL